MSTAKTAPRKAPTQPAKAGVTVKSGPVTEKPVLEKIEVTSLQLDESYDADCDPYNCTGQHLVDAAKLKNGE